ncbi:MAG: ferrous iron transporter B, partial [Candidatus Sumerlaeota bacterium]|nr:ferrous iron transporter B [Candidatus Sumerlaeota bacterium]
VIDGVGGVLAFVPIICFMFFAIAILEDSGYMARAAFLLDRVMRRFGLHGQSVIAMVVSGGLAGGCAAPGVMATRTLREPRERLATILVCPFMNCGAKLPVYAMLIAAFFSGRETAMMLLLTAISWAMALAGAWLLRKSIVRGPRAPFLMELPPYRMPTLRSLLMQTLHRVSMYIRKAGTVILAASVLLWALMTFPRLPTERTGAAGDPGAQAQAALAHSAAGRLGKGLSAVLSPLGMDWRTSIALVGGFAAKEVVVSTLSTAYSLGAAQDENTGALSHRLAADPSWSPLKAFVLLLFVMLYAPCVSTIAVVIQETRSWKWGLFSMSFSTGLAWLVGFAVYQAGRMLGIGI